MEFVPSHTTAQLALQVVGILLTCVQIYYAHKVAGIVNPVEKYIIGPIRKSTTGIKERILEKISTFAKNNKQEVLYIDKDDYKIDVTEKSSNFTSKNLVSGIIQNELKKLNEMDPKHVYHIVEDIDHYKIVKSKVENVDIV